MIILSKAGALGVACDGVRGNACSMRWWTRMRRAHTTDEHVRERAKARGWTVVDGTDRCPECQRSERERPARLRLRALKDAGGKVQGCCYGLKCSRIVDGGPECMEHAPGITCGTCYAFQHCQGLFGCRPESTSCDWFPNRYSPAKAQETER